ncbi:MAG: glycosyltransferase family 4 protein [Fuerstiella sp.]|nr:glycosyltransferase family 4 protein [Fuerstiella sp.]
MRTPVSTIENGDDMLFQNSRRKRRGDDILFLGHDASRTGAPIVLLRMLRWLRENTDLSFSVILGAGGPLEPDYSEVANTKVCYLATQTESHFLRPLLKIPGLRRVISYSHRRLLRLRLRFRKPQMIYANTSATGDMLEFFDLNNVPTVTHVHELEVVLRTLIGLRQFAQTIRHTNRFLAVSQAVRQNLMQNHNISDDDIEMVPEFLPIGEHSPENWKNARLNFVQRFDMPEDAFIVGASGTPGWRKGSDLFVQVAGHVARTHPEAPIYFAWIGGPLSATESEYLLHDCDRLGVRERIRFIDTQPDPIALFQGLSVFAMVSREDPYPIVTIETAAEAVPIVCFDQAGGTQELVEDDAGFVVPYLDTAAMANRIVELFDAPGLRNQLGNRAREKVLERNNAAVVMPLIADVIRRNTGNRVD